MSDNGSLAELVALTRQVQGNFTELPVLPAGEIEAMIDSNPLAFAYPVDPMGLATGHRYDRNTAPSILLAGDLSVPGSPLQVMMARVAAFAEQAERAGHADLDAYRSMLIEGWTEIGLPSTQQQRLLEVFDRELAETDAAGQIEWRVRPNDS